jgi:hypothetical protein
MPIHIADHSLQEKSLFDYNGHGSHDIFILSLAFC